jgi:hypothetical protein
VLSVGVPAFCGARSCIFVKNLPHNHIQATLTLPLKKQNNSLARSWLSLGPILDRTRAIEGDDLVWMGDAFVAVGIVVVDAAADFDVDGIYGAGM